MKTKNMNKKFKTFLALLTTLLIFISIALANNIHVQASTVSNYHSDDINLEVKSAIAVDAKNGQVFYAKNAKQKLPVASMSKLITIYLTLEAIRDHRLSWEQTVTPTEQMVKVSTNPDYSGVPLVINHSYTIKQLYEATLIQSANGPAMLLGQAVAGSQVNFVNKMRSLVKKWGITGAEIYTPDGLPNYTQGPDAYPGADKNAENKLSASDMAIVVDHLLTDFPEVINTTKIVHKDFDDQGQITKMTNWNWMLPGLSQADEDLPLDGLKTGTTDAAGACFAGTMLKNGRRLITIVMGARHQDGSDPSRFIQTKKLLNYVFSNYQLYILKKGQNIDGVNIGTVPQGKEEKVKLYLQKDTGVWIKNNSSVKARAISTNIAAPVKKNRKIGYFYLNVPSIKSDQGVKLPAMSKHNIKKANIFVRIWRWIF